MEKKRAVPNADVIVRKLRNDSIWVSIRVRGSSLASHTSPLPTKDNKNQVSTHFSITTHDYSADNQETNFLNQQVLK